MTDTNDNATPKPASSASEAPLLGMREHAQLRQVQQNTNKALWGIFVLLLVLVGVVIFVLPSWVPEPDAAETAAAASAAQTPVQPAAPAISPFEEAQRMRQRQSAQDALAELLELQDTLEQKQVQDWALAAYDAALEQARLGDEAYREQRFEEAEASYRAGVAALQAIEAGEETTYQQAMTSGATALQSGEAETAVAAFSQALLIKPDSMDAATGLERATVLGDVVALLDSGRALHANNEFEAAREEYRKAQALDGANTDVAAELQRVASDIAQRDFNAVMSRGYAALQSGDADAALRAFQQAAAQRPGSAEVEAALQQARDRQTTAAITVHIDAALGHEDAEEWTQAVAAWDEALTVDPNLVDAIQGRARSESRRALDEFLQNTIANPLRLADEAVNAQTRQVLADAARIGGAGPRLQGQIAQINDLLERAQVPVTVQLQSDGLTAVTVYRVGDLGTFTNYTLSLLPGSYVAVGVRAGYRDVRQEFTIGLDGQVPLVTIACSEAI